VTLILLFLNLLVFAFGCALAVRGQVPLNDFIGGGGPNAIRTENVLTILHQTGAIQRKDLVANGEWWRLLTCCFVHIGLLHLAVNMYSLYVVGPLLERMWGTWRFLVLYLIAALVGSCTMVLFSVPKFIGAGASGALWGIMASMATWVFLNRGHLPRQLVSAWKRSLLIVFILNVFITYGFPSVSASAHFGGGIAGLVVAVPLEYVRYSHGWRRWLAAAAVAAVPLAALAFVHHDIAGERERQQQEANLQASIARIGWSERLKGLSTRPRISSVTAPRRGSSPGSPKMTGVCPSPCGKEMWHSEILRSTLVPSARVKVIFRLGLRPMAFQSFSGRRV
jgi:membrane associated rhomboid family serine protease